MWSLPIFSKRSTGTFNWGKNNKKLFLDKHRSVTYADHRILLLKRVETLSEGRWLSNDGVRCGKVVYKESGRFTTLFCLISSLARDYTRWYHIIQEQEHACSFSRAASFFGLGISCPYALEHGRDCANCLVSFEKMEAKYWSSLSTRLRVAGLVRSQLKDPCCWHQLDKCVK